MAGIVTPDSSVTLFDPQAHTYVMILILEFSSN